MKKKMKKSLVRSIVQFIKLQLAGNVLFWGTYLGHALLHEVWHWDSVYSLATASIISHIAFFILDRNWVFSDKSGQRKTSGELMKFIAFMGLNYFINLGIVLGLEQRFGISPYIGQFGSALFFTFWTYLGLKFWVFRHVRHARPHALTLETANERKRRYEHYRRRAAKQKAKRTA